MIKKYLTEIFESALKKINAPIEIKIAFENSKNPEHGDYAFTGAMNLAKAMQKAPRKIAEEILAVIEYDSQYIEKLEIAGPGFINIKLAKSVFAQNLETILEDADNFGRSDKYIGKKVNVEYVSVNPTGLLHLGHGRNACIGDTVANLYSWLGADVTREYYFNNAGNQMNNLAKSIYARYMQKYINTDYTFPEDGYHGLYIIEIADELFKEEADKLKKGNEEDLLRCRKFGEKWCFEKITKTLERLHIKQDYFYNEDTLYSDGKIDNLIKELEKMDLVYESEGAKWLKLSQLGLESDRVIVKSTGEATYRLPDIAYHKEKFERGFDEIVDVFGADHIATVPDVIATLKALDYDTERINVLIHQFVTLTENGQQVKMSKRTGKSYTLDDLLDEVGEDVVRFFLLMRQISTHLEFDLDVARQQSDKNPVFYLQYAHARCWSVIEKSEIDINTILKSDLTVLVADEEINMIKTLIRFPDIVLLACEKREPQIVAEYLRDAAAAFHIFYHECRVLGQEESIMKARILLTFAVKTVLKNGLAILGIKAPNKM
ncbi:MAG: arginine--tRNA ligase [bacterium]